MHCATEIYDYVVYHCLLLYVRAFSLSVFVQLNFVCSFGFCQTNTNQSIRNQISDLLHLRKLVLKFPSLTLVHNERRN